MKTELAELLESDLLVERFKSVAPSSMKLESEKGFAVQLMQANKQLADAAMSNPKSMQAALANVAAVGLSLNPVKKQAYLITRNVKVGDKWGSKVCLEPSYMGLCDVATSSGMIDWVQADIVYSEDDFTHNGMGEKPTHKRNPFSKDRGEIVGVYCCAKTSKSDYLTEVMPIDEINSIRDRSDGWKAYKAGKIKSTPWLTDFNQMAKKTVIRRGFNTWPKSKELDRMSEAVHISNENEGFEPLISEPKMSGFNAEQKSYFDQLIESGDNLGMFVLKRTLVNGDNAGSGASTWIDLMHSFPKGSKGKYGSIVSDMVGAGESAFCDMLTAIEDAADRSDEVGVMEVANDVSNDVLTELISSMRTDLENFANETVKENG